MTTFTLLHKSSGSSKHKFVPLHTVQHLTINIHSDVFFKSIFVIVLYFTPAPPGPKEGGGQGPVLRQRVIYFYLILKQK